MRFLREIGDSLAEMSDLLQMPSEFRALFDSVAGAVKKHLDAL